MSKGDASWRFYQNLVLSAAIRAIALPKATASVIGVADQGLISAWRIRPGMRATAKDATARVYVLLATERGTSGWWMNRAVNAPQTAPGVYRDTLRML